IRKVTGRRDGPLHEDLRDAGSRALAIAASKHDPAKTEKGFGPSDFIESAIKGKIHDKTAKAKRRAVDLPDYIIARSKEVTGPEAAIANEEVRLGQYREEILAGSKAQSAGREVDP